MKYWVLFCAWVCLFCGFAGPLQAEDSANEPRLGVWERLSGDAMLGFRFCLNDETVQRYGERYPELHTFWQDMGDRLDDFIQQNLGEDQCTENLKQSLGIDIRRDIADIKGEWGYAILIHPVIQDLRFMIWSTPEQGVDALFAKLLAYGQEAVERDPQTYFVGKQEFGGKEVWKFMVAFEPAQKEGAEEGEGAVQGYPVRTILLAKNADTLFVIPVLRDEDNRVSDWGRWDEIEIANDSIDYLLPLIWGNEKGGSLAGFVDNPANRFRDEDKLWEMSVDLRLIIANYASAFQRGLEEMRQGKAHVLGYLLSNVDWLKILGLNKAESVYIRAAYAPSGMNVAWGVGGAFMEPGEDNLLRSYANPDLRGIEFMSWIPDTVRSYTVGGSNLREAYRLIKGSVQQINPTVWNVLSDTFIKVVSVETGYTLEEIMSAMGDQVYRVSGYVNKDKGGEVRFVEIRKPEVIAAVVAKIPEIQKNFKMTSFEEVSLQGFEGWSMDISIVGKNVRSYLLENGRYLVFASESDFTDTILNAMNRSAEDLQGFFRNTEIFRGIEEVERVEGVALRDHSVVSIEKPKLGDGRLKFGMSFDMTVGELSLEGMMKALYLDPLKQYAIDRASVRIEYSRIIDRQGLLVNEMLLYSEPE